MKTLTEVIKEEAISTKVFEIGESYYKEKKVKNLEMTEAGPSLPDGISVTAEVEGNFKIPYHVNFSIWTQEGNYQIKYKRCTCPAYHRYGKICRHMVAAALEFMDNKKDWIREKENATDKNALKLIKKFRDKNRNTALADTSSGRMHLEVWLQEFYQGITVKFKVGETKMYVIKDLNEFRDAFSEGRLVEYGKNLKFYHTMANFVQEDRKLVEFILKNTQDIRDTSQGYYSYSRRAIKEWLLEDYVLDEFLQICEGKKVYFTDRYNQKSEVLVKAENTKIDIEISKKAEESYYLELNDSCTFQGKQHIYVVKPNEGTMYCCDEEYYDKMSNFLNITNGKVLTIHEKDMQVLYAEVLEQIDPYVELTKKSVDLEQFMPPEAEAVFYLDAPQYDQITCKAVMKYGEQEVNLFEEEKNITYRDMATEFQLKDLLKRYLTEWDKKEKAVYCENDEEAVYDFVTQAMPLLYEYGTVMATDAIKKIGIRRSPKVSVGVSVKSDLLELEINVSEYGTDVLKEMLGAYRKKKRYYRLKSGEFVSLASEEFGVLDELVEGLQISGKDLKEGKTKLPLYRAMYLDRILKENDRISYDRDHYFKHLVKNIKSVEDSDYEVPASLKGVLRGYQKTGYRWLRTLDEYGFGGILADDMGLGKTLQVITFLAAKKEELEQKEEHENQILALIVCPASLVYNWENELQKFAPQLTKKVLAGEAKERREALQEQTDIFIISYDTLRRDIEYYEDKNFYCQIVDEAQFIKNQTTQASKAVKAIHSKVRFALTGTPIENRLSELWSIFDYLMPDYLYHYAKFKKELETPIVQEQNEECLERLQRMLKPFILRRVKKEVLKELPDKVEQVVYSQLKGEQKKLYIAETHAMLESVKQTSEKEYKENKLQILAQLTKLRQICCAPELYFEDYKGEHAKIDTALELIHNAIEGGHKILIFSQFANLLFLMEDILQKEGIDYYILTGKTGKEKRITMVNEFNKNEVSIFLISLKAGGTGLNLTAADVVIHLDPWWNVAAQNQATDRAHRIGQENVVTVFNLIAKDTIEEKILKMQEQKKDLTDQVLSNKDMAIHSLTQEELMNILEA